MKKIKFPLLSALTLSLVVSVAGAQDSVVLKPYGFIKLDMAYDRDQTNDGNYVFWVNPSSKEGKNSEFNMTTRQTRLGANISYDKLADKNVTARFEFDFYGGGAENKNLPMLRQGFVKVDFGKYFLLAGQSSDVFSPLVPTTVNYTVLWNCGNIGYRHPQVQFGNITASGFEFVGALSRNIAGDFDKDGNDDGENSASPIVQARVSYLNSKMNVGLSGHYGKMRFTKFVNCHGCDSYSVNVHYSYYFTDTFQVKGEAFSGKTLNEYLGGVGQGFDTIRGKEIESNGGWINVGFKANSKIFFNLGYGLDNPRLGAGAAIPNRTSNSCLFGNMFSEIAYHTTLAMELSNWTTGYDNTDGKKSDISNVRFQVSFIHNI